MSGAFWSISSAGISRGMNLLAMVLVARVLNSKEGYGSAGVVLTFVGAMSQFASMGIGLTATKHVAEFRLKDPKRAARILSFVMMLGCISIILMSVVEVATAWFLADRLYGQPELGLPLAVAAMLLGSSVATLMLEGAMAGFEDFKGIARNTVRGSLAMVPLAVPLTWWLGLPGMVVGLSLAQMVTVVLHLRSVLSNSRSCNMHLSPRGVWEERGIFWRYAMPSFLTAACTAPAVMLSNAAVSRSPGGLMGLGGYNAANQWGGFVLFLPRALRRLTLPMLSRLQGDPSDSQRYMRALWANLALNGGVAALMAIPLALLSPWIMSIYGPEYRGDWDILAIVAMAGIFQAVNDVVTQVSASMGKIWWDWAIHVVWGAVLLSLTLVLVPHMGVRGQVWAVAVAMANHMVLNIVAARFFIRARARQQATALAMAPATLQEQAKG